jgi:hypothetical protein
MSTSPPSEEKTLEILADLANGLEALAVSVKKHIAEITGVAEHLDYNQLGWVEQKGTKGPYEQASRQNSKVDIFDTLAKELKEHNGFWQHDGWRYWFHKGDETTIDRRKVGFQFFPPDPSKKMGV